MSPNQRGPNLYGIKCMKAELHRHVTSWLDKAVIRWRCPITFRELAFGAFWVHSSNFVLKKQSHIQRISQSYSTRRRFHLRKNENGCTSSLLNMESLILGFVWCGQTWVNQNLHITSNLEGRWEVAFIRAIIIIYIQTLAKIYFSFYIIIIFCFGPASVLSPKKNYY